MDDYNNGRFNQFLDSIRITNLEKWTDWSDLQQAKKSIFNTDTRIKYVQEFLIRSSGNDVSSMLLDVLTNEQIEELIPSYYKVKIICKSLPLISNLRLFN
jgi:hypothetical protein